MLRKVVFHDPNFADDAWVRAIVETWKQRDRRKAFVATAFSLRRPDASVAAHLQRLTVPTLVLSGRQDVQFSWQSAKQAAELIPGAHFSVVEDAAHFPMVERPQETAALIQQFLSEDAV